MALSLLLVLACQDPTTATEATATVRERHHAASIVSGALDRGAFRLDAMGLGGGGVGSPVRPPRERSGQHVTTGGILVRARAEGVKLDFPSGAELLVNPAGSVHHRSGARTMTSFHGVELWLADGARVQVQPAPGGRGPCRSVQVVAGGKTVTLWRRHHPLRRPETRSGPFTGTSYLALGDGDVLYRPAAFGPVLTLERVLCARRQERVYPRRRLVIAGDVLAASLRRLPEHVPPTLIQFPQAPAAARNLAHAAPLLFPVGAVHRPRGAVGAMVFGLASGFRLALQQHGHGERGEPRDLRIGLHRGASPVPVVEWRVGTRTTLHLVRPAGGAGGTPRYYLRGIDITARLRDLWPGFHDGAARKRAWTTMRELGVRRPVGTVRNR